MRNPQLAKSKLKTQILKARRKQSQNSLEPSLINDLLTELDRKRISYCHWKSNWRIDRWLAGEGDLDLLVARKDAEKFTEALSQMGFKKAFPPPEKDFPGIINYYGWDSETQRIIHVHVHFQLVFGHDFTKNYRLPVEKSFLAEVVGYKNIYLPSPEMEFIFFVIRMVLKFWVPEFWARKIFRKKMNALNREIKGEINYLEGRINEIKLQAVLKKTFPMIGSDLFFELRESLESDAGIRRKVLAKRKLEKSLSAYSRKSVWTETATKYRNAIFQIIRKIPGKGAKRKKFENGGIVIAIVGGDGAGKTTAVESISGWLSKKFAVRKVHIGKPAKSFSTIVVGGALKISRRLFKKLPENKEKGEFLQNLRWVCTARDRYKLFKKIRRHSANGDLVICDRYPIPELKLMDGPKIGKGVKRINKYDKFLSRWETRYYERITQPEELFVLRVEPRTAVNRKPDEEVMHVYQRSRELWKFDWQNIDGHLIDANRTAEEVFADLQKEIWKII